MMSARDTVKNNYLIRKLYEEFKSIQEKRLYKNNFRYHGIFRNRSKGYTQLLIVLAGYKEFSYTAVFSRIQRYLEKEIDVCVVSSGKYSEKLEAICQENQWSYLSTKENNVGLVQNVAIKLHPKAEYIFKLDEDIFITKKYFANMLKAYKHAEQCDYNPGLVAPILPINGYGYMRILEKCNLTGLYTERFGRPKYTSESSEPIISNPDVAQFFWAGGVVPSIDELNTQFSASPIEERPCPIRFSIGAVLFKRSLWEEMRYFSVNRWNAGMGKDEEKICLHCCLKSRPVMVSENIVVGHLSFTEQNAVMREYYTEHEEEFLYGKDEKNNQACIKYGSACEDGALGK